LEKEDVRGAETRNPELVLEELLKSNQSILINIEELRKRGGLQ
jgi:hypothetical protein